MRNYFISLLIVLMVLINTKNVFAYIDPGTGGMIIGNSLWPFIIGIFALIGGFFLKYFFKPIKKGALAIWRRIKRKG